MLDPAPRRALVHRHHVRKRLVEQAVVLLQQALERACKRLVILCVEVLEASSMGDGREMDLIWPACEWRDECDPPLVAQHGPLAAALALDDVAVQTPAGPSHVPRLGGQFTLDYRGNKWIWLDLAVRMAQGDADRLASVLEHEHVPDLGEPAD